MNHNVPDDRPEQTSDGTSPAPVNHDDDLIMFDASGPAQESATVANPASAEPPWRVLIVDDEPSVHEVTEFVMRGFVFEGRKLEFLHSYSAAEARTVLTKERDVAIILLDVVMESDDAGLQVASYLRQELANAFPRIILRTGQPGHAPEERVIREYDINDYKEKSELTERKLKTIFIASLRSYRDLIRLERARQSLYRTINAIASIRNSQNLFSFASSLLVQLKNLIGLDGDAVCASRVAAYAASRAEGDLKIMAVTDGYLGRCNSGDSNELPPAVRAEIIETFSTRKTHHTLDRYVGYFGYAGGTEGVLHVTFGSPVPDLAYEYMTIFAENVILTYEYLLAREEVESSQHSAIMLVCEAVEKRSKETGAHVQRVGEISAILASEFGITPREVEFLRQAAPLHDLGKIGIPDHVLNKPGKLDPDEWEIMKTHAQIGMEMLRKSDSPMLLLGASVAGEHHECWDGSGYPNGLKGNDISLAGRVVALADVLDALVSKRCYKAPWTFEDARTFILAESGKRFDPRVVQAFIDRQEDILMVYEQLPD